MLRKPRGKQRRRPRPRHIGLRVVSSAPIRIYGVYFSCPGILITSLHHAQVLRPHNDNKLLSQQCRPPSPVLVKAHSKYKAQKKKPKRRVQFDAGATLSPPFQLPFSIASRYSVVFTPPFLKHDFYGLIFDPK